MRALRAVGWGRFPIIHGFHKLFARGCADCREFPENLARSVERHEALLGGAGRALLLGRQVQSLTWKQIVGSQGVHRPCVAGTVKANECKYLAQFAACEIEVHVSAGRLTSTRAKQLQQAGLQLLRLWDLWARAGRELSPPQAGRSENSHNARVRVARLSQGGRSDSITFGVLGRNSKGMGWASLRKLRPEGLQTNHEPLGSSEPCT